MKFAVMSDIHGNMPALEAVLRDIDTQQVDAVYQAGDMVNYGGQSPEVLDLVQKLGIPGVKGNHDHAVEEDPVFWRARGVESLHVTRTLLREKHREFLRTLPTSLEVGESSLCVHGVPPDDFNTYVNGLCGRDMRTIMKHMRQKIAFVGHTHHLVHYESHAPVPIGELLGEGELQLDPAKTHIVNVGSVGQPRDDIDKRAKYITFDDEAFCLEVRAVKYDIQAAAQAIMNRGYPDENAKRLYPDGLEYNCPKPTMLSRQLPRHWQQRLIQLQSWFRNP